MYNSFIYFKPFQIVLVFVLASVYKLLHFGDMKWYDIIFVRLIMGMGKQKMYMFTKCADFSHFPANKFDLLFPLCVPTYWRHSKNVEQYWCADTSDGIIFELCAKWNCEWCEKEINWNGFKLEIYSTNCNAIMSTWLYLTR